MQFTACAQALRRRGLPRGSITPAALRAFAATPSLRAVGVPVRMSHTNVPVGPAAVLPRTLTPPHLHRHAEVKPVGAAAGAAGKDTTAHHGPDGTFVNPWASYVDRTPVDFLFKA
jgi:hypothetical protein